MSETIFSVLRDQFQSQPPERTALRWIDSALKSTEVTWGGLDSESNRRAVLLQRCGCIPGSHVLIDLQSSPEIWNYFLGALKCGAVPCVLFPSFGPEALKARLESGKANFLILDRWQPKFLEAVKEIPLKKIICLKGEIPQGQDVKNILCAESLPLEENCLPEAAEIRENNAAFMVFTSGSTGNPKAVVHTQRIAPAVVRSMRSVLQLQPTDLFWCTAHPAWITGTVYGILGPLLAGVESIQYTGIYHPSRWMSILQDQKVNVWYSAPTAFRAMMKEPLDFYEKYSLSSLRTIFSIGEPLSAAIYQWGNSAFKHEIHDTWFQTETGTVRIASLPGEPVKPGWMGKAVDDSEVMIRNQQGSEAAPGEPGMLFLREGWESCFAAYQGQKEAYQNKFEHGWYRTDDLACRDENGYLQFYGREDDVINTSGHLVGPFEIESVLLEQPEVAEAAVCAEKDPAAYEKPAAFIVLKKGIEWNHELETRLKSAVFSHVSPYAVPKSFYIMKELPKTSSGKIIRKMCRPETH